MESLYPTPSTLPAPAANAQKLFEEGKFRETVTLCRQELAALEQTLPARYLQAPRNAAVDSAPFQYFALTLVLVNALAQLQEWKPAKETLGKYRVRFPRDPWGFYAGAEVTRRDTQVKDKAAVERAAELLQEEAKRLEGMK